MADKLLNPCYNYCYLQFQRQYSPECDDMCEFAQFVRDYNNLRVYMSKCVDKQNLLSALDAMFKKIDKPSDDVTNLYNQIVALIQGFPGAG